MIDKYKAARDNKLNQEFNSDYWIKWNFRFLKTYKKILSSKFKSKILDIGCGTNHFSMACNRQGFDADGIDIDTTDFEKDKLPFANNLFNVVHFNAVIEHILNPDNIFKEIKRILKPKGVFIVNTPNWQIDFKNFYNDPTHIRPYTPVSLKSIMEMYGFKVIVLEPALICKPSFFFKLPDSIKWCVSAMIKGGSKSILCIGETDEKSLF